MDEESEDPCVYGALVTVRFIWGEPPTIDSYIDTSCIVGDKYKVADVLSQLGGDPEAMKKCAEVAGRVVRLTLRVRFNNDVRGPYHFTSDTPLTFELMEKLVAGYSAADFDRLDKTARLGAQITGV